MILLVFIVLVSESNMVGCHRLNMRSPTKEPLADSNYIQLGVSEDDLGIEEPGEAK